MGTGGREPGLARRRALAYRRARALAYRRARALAYRRARTPAYGPSVLPPVTEAVACMGQQPGGQGKRAEPRTPREAGGAVLAASATRSQIMPVNPGCPPGVADRTSRSPRLAAMPVAVRSRSYTTSM